MVPALAILLVLLLAPATESIASPHAVPPHVAAVRWLSPVSSKAVIAALVGVVGGAHCFSSLVREQHSLAFPLNTSRLLSLFSSWGGFNDDGSALKESCSGDDEGGQCTGPPVGGEGDDDQQYTSLACLDRWQWQSPPMQAGRFPRIPRAPRTKRRIPRQQAPPVRRQPPRNLLPPKKRWHQDEEALPPMPCPSSAGLSRHGGSRTQLVAAVVIVFFLLLRARS